MVFLLKYSTTKMAYIHKLESYPNGQVKLERVFFSDDEFSYEENEYLDNGNIKNKKIFKYYCFIKEIIYYAYKPEQIFQIYEHDLNRTNYVMYYDNGHIETKGQFEDRKQVGEWIWYYQNGQITTVRKFNNGVKNGIQIFYRENGLIAYEGMIVDGKNEGEWIWYDIKGQITCKRIYVAHVLKSEWLAENNPDK